MFKWLYRGILHVRYIRTRQFRLGWIKVNIIFSLHQGVTQANLTQSLKQFSSDRVSCCSQNGKRATNADVGHSPRYSPTIICYETTQNKLNSVNNGRNDTEPITRQLASKTKWVREILRVFYVWSKNLLMCSEITADKRNIPLSQRFSKKKN